MEGTYVSGLGNGGVTVRASRVIVASGSGGAGGSSSRTSSSSSSTSSGSSNRVRRTTAAEVIHSRTDKPRVVSRVLLHAPPFDVKTRGSGLVQSGKFDPLIAPRVTAVLDGDVETAHVQLDLVGG